jgi:hypothetical protein
MNAARMKPALYRSRMALTVFRWSKDVHRMAHRSFTQAHQGSLFLINFR